MQSFLQLLLARPVTVAMASCAVSFGGLFALVRLPLGLAPSLEFPALSIHMNWGGASAETVEQILTGPVEEIVSSLRGVRKVRSASRDGNSRVNVEFDQQTDMNFARLDLNERLALFAQRLPAGASRPVVDRYIPEDIEQLQGFLRYSVTGSLSRMALARVAEEEIVPLLMRVRGVTHVTLDGREEQEVRIELSPERLSAAGITAADVLTAVEESHPESCGGTLPGPAGVEGINVAGNAVSLREVEEVPVRRTGCLIRLRDVGTAAIVRATPRELLRINGEECLTLTVTRDPRSSLIGTAREVRSCLAGVSPRLPPSVSLVCEMDQSLRMEHELGILYRDAVFSLVLLWGTLVLFLGSGRAPLLLISTVLLSIAGTLLALWLLQISLHLLTLAGLVLGFGRLLDDSIVVLENLRRWSGSGVTTRSVVRGTQEIAMPVVASTLATAGAMAPVLSLPKGLQVYFLEFATAVAVSLAISLLVSLTVIPSAALHWRMEGRKMLMHPHGYASALYRRLLNRALRHRMLILLAAVWIFGVPVWLLPLQIEGPSLVALLYNKTIGTSWYTSFRPIVNTLLGGASYQFFRNIPHAEFLDPERGTYLIMQVDFPQGTDISSEDPIARFFEQALLCNGAPRVTTHLLDGALLLRVDFPDSVIATSLPQALRGLCFQLAAQTGGAAVSVAGFGGGFSGGVDLQPAFMVRVLGYDYTHVRQIAQSLRERLLRNPRVVSADIDRALGKWSRMQELALIMDRDATVRYDLTRREIAATVRNRISALPGKTSLNLQGIHFPYVVTVKGSDRISIADLASVSVSGKLPSAVPLSSLLNVQQRPAPSEIVREDQQYVRWVSFEYKGPYRHARAYLDATISSFPLPEGYRLDGTDSLTVPASDRDALLFALLAALLVVFMVTASLYESLLDPLIVMLSVPLAYIGVFAAFVLTGMPFGRGGYLSVIFLTGIAVANAVVIVDFITRKRREGTSGVDAIIEASVCRLRPVLMTSLTTAGSLVPMLLGERSSVWYSLALGTCGGILSSALLTLVVIPVVYMVAHRVKK